MIGASRRTGTVGPGRPRQHPAPAGTRAASTRSTRTRRTSAACPALPDVAEPAGTAGPRADRGARRPTVLDAAGGCGRHGVSALVVFTAAVGRRRLRRPARRLPQARHAAGRAELLRHRGARRSASTPRSPPPPAGRARPGWSCSPAASASRWSTSCPGSASASPRSRRSATSSTCPATTCCCGGNRTSVTRLAVLYIESFGNPRKFGRTARRVGARMPVLTVHAGRSAAGQRAAASHTAAVATPLATGRRCSSRRGSSPRPASAS